MPERAIGPPSDSDLDVKRLRLKPGDILVLNIDQPITRDQAAEIKARVEPIVAPHRVLILSGGITIEIMEPGV